MACTISSGRSRGCRDNSGGVYTIYIGNYPDNIVNPFDWDGSTGTGYAQLDVNGNKVISFNTGLTEFNFYEFVPNKQSSEFIESYETSLENGTVGYNQSVTAIFSKMNADTRGQIALLTAGNFLVIIKDKNGKYWLMGAYDAAVLSAGQAGTGKALTDLNGYTLTMTALEGSPAFEVDEAALLTVVV